MTTKRYKDMITRYKKNLSSLNEQISKFEPKTNDDKKIKKLEAQRDSLVKRIENLTSYSKQVS